MAIIRVGVGSRNPAKLRSVEIALSRIWPKATIVVTGHDVVSGVDAQPLSMGATRLGSNNRAQAIFNASSGSIDFAVGLEGGIENYDDDDTWFECGWCTVIDRTGKIGIGSTARSQISSSIVKRLRAGEELSAVVDDLAGLSNVRNDNGYMGIITNGALPRDLCYSHAVMFAFSRFVSDPIFWA